MLLFGRDFWTKLLNFDLLVETGMISALDLQLFSFVVVASGMTQSQAIRLSLVEALHRRTGDRSLAAEAARLAADDADRCEIADVRAFMDELRAPW